MENDMFFNFLGELRIYILIEMFFNVSAPIYTKKAWKLYILKQH